MGGNIIKSFAETGDVASTQVGEILLFKNNIYNDSDDACDPIKTKQIRDKYESMIADARLLGKNVAADNLQHFVNGSGNKKLMSVEWLRNFSSVKDSESRILIYTKERNIKEWIKKADTNKPIITTYWDAGITDYNPTAELTYASGGSSLKGTVNISILKSSSFFIFSGDVKILWYDIYDWNKGNLFYIPGSGDISDDDGIYLEKCGKAKAFKMEANWKFDLSAKFDILDNRWTEMKWFLNGTEYIPLNNTPDNDTR